jgi:co-chaperonin GroES (HSP10)
MSFRPLHDFVAIRAFEPDQKTATGIVLPDIAKQKPEQGEVIAVGPGRRDKHGVIRAPRFGRASASFLARAADMRSASMVRSYW